MLYGRNDPESLVPYQPFIAALQHYFAHREDLRLPQEITLELSELARFVPALRRHVGDQHASLADDAETRRYRLFEGVTRMLHLRRPRAARWCCCSTTCTGPTPSTTLLLGHLLQDAAHDAPARARHRAPVRERGADAAAAPAVVRAHRARPA